MYCVELIIYQTCWTFESPLVFFILNRTCSFVWALIHKTVGFFFFVFLIKLRKRDYVKTRKKNQILPVLFQIEAKCWLLTICTIYIRAVKITIHNKDCLYHNDLVALSKSNSGFSVAFTSELIGYEPRGSLEVLQYFSYHKLVHSYAHHGSTQTSKTQQ